MLRWSLCVGLLLGLSACAGLTRSSQVEPTQYFQADAKRVLAAAEEVLERRGYVFEAKDLSDGMLVGQHVERIAGSGRDAYLRSAVVRTQVVIEAAPAEGGTELLASFNINIRSATGERRTWSPETSEADKLRRQFYSELQEELSGTFTSSSIRP